MAKVFAKEYSALLFVFVIVHIAAHQSRIEDPAIFVSENGVLKFGGGFRLGESSIQEGSSVFLILGVFGYVNLIPQSRAPTRDIRGCHGVCQKGTNTCHIGLTC